MNRRGFTLIELVVATGLGLMVIAIGYKAYFGALRVDDHAAKRESLTLGVQNLMARIKQDVRGAHALNVANGTLTIDGGRVIYRNTDAGVERGKCVYRDTRAEFTSEGQGVDIRLRAGASVHKRLVRVEVESYVRPRN